MTPLQYQERGIFRPNHYFKKYESGSLSGQTIQVEKEEFIFWKKETEALWGTTDFWGDWVPGLYRRELPVMNESTYGVPEII